MKYIKYGMRMIIIICFIVGSYGMNNEDNKDNQPPKIELVNKNGVEKPLLKKEILNEEKATADEYLAGTPSEEEHVKLMIPYPYRKFFEDQEMSKYRSKRNKRFYRILVHILFVPIQLLIFSQELSDEGEGGSDNYLMLKKGLIVTFNIIWIVVSTKLAKRISFSYLSLSESMDKFKIWLYLMYLIFTLGGYVNAVYSLVFLVQSSLLPGTFLWYILIILGAEIIITLVVFFLLYNEPRY